MKRRLVLFDIDGTLLLSNGAGRRAILAALDRLVPSGPEARAIRFDGKTDPQIVAELLAVSGVSEPGEPTRIATLLARYVVCLERELARPGHRTRLMPGVAPLLDRIESDTAAVLGLLTGNVLAGAHLKLRSAALEPERFVVGAYGSDHPDRARLPAVAASRAVALFGREPRGPEIVIIGDTPADVSCGASLGARSIGVATGSYSPAELRAAGAWAVFPDLSGADAVWEAICG